MLQPGISWTGYRRCLQKASKGLRESKRVVDLRRHMEIIVERLTEENFNTHSLDNFIRHQVVTECWRKVDGNWILLPISFVEEWSLDKCREEASAMENNLYGDMIDYGAFEKTDLIGYITVGTEKLGTDRQYLQLVSFQVSEPFRGMGVGRMLFEKAVTIARGYGAKK
jgi:GNAT superfamily N-acetyltransferase